MQIYLIKNNAQVGPYTEPQIRAMVSSGEVGRMDNAWHEGLSEWRPLNTVLNFNIPPPPPIPPQQAGDQGAIAPRNSSLEHVIYTDEHVSISTSRIILGATTYALRNITSVKMLRSPGKRGCSIMLLIAAGFALLIAMNAHALAALIIAVVFGIVGFLWYRAIKDDFHVLIASSSGEERALTSTDQLYIEKVVSAINDAIVQYR